MIYIETQTPLGSMLLLSDGVALCGAWFVGQKHFPLVSAAWEYEQAHPVLRLAVHELEAYFSQGLRTFTVALAPQGTEFQQFVWQCLLQIPAGASMHYGAIVAQLGRGSARAVGGAVGRNPLSIFIPCHRVVGKDGRLTGYAGGIERKTYLLQLEDCKGYKTMSHYGARFGV